MRPSSLPLAVVLACCISREIVAEEVVVLELGECTIENVKGSSSISLGNGCNIVDGPLEQRLALLESKMNLVLPLVVPPPSSPPPPPMPPPHPPPQPPLWILGTASAYTTSVVYDETFPQILARCAAMSSCDYIVDHGCDSNIFKAVGALAGTTSQPHGAYLSSSGLAMDNFDNNQFAGTVGDTLGTWAYTDHHAWRINTLSGPSDQKLYPSSGWDTVGDTTINDAPHCLLKKP